MEKGKLRTFDSLKEYFILLSKPTFKLFYTLFNQL